jgi:hypothetical protein
VIFPVCLDDCPEPAIGQSAYPISFATAIRHDLVASALSLAGRIAALTWFKRHRSSKNCFCVAFSMEVSPPGPTASAHPDQLTAWQPYGATLAPAPNANEGARNANDREVNARPRSGCARFNDGLRELWPRGMRCD